MTKIISKYKFHILIFIFAFLILTKFTIDPDLGWHIAMGQRFLETGEVIMADQFSWTMPGRVWVSPYFAYQILAAFLFNNVGLIPSTVIFGFIGSFGVLILLPRKLNLWKSLAIGLGISCAIVNLGLRPHTISFLLFAILLVFLERRFFEKWWHGVFWFGLFAIWANFHQGFLVGFLVLGTYLAIDFFWQREKGKKEILTIRFLVILAAFAGTVLTPLFLEYWRFLFIEAGGSHGVFGSIAEFLPIVVYFPSNLLYGLSGLAFTYIFIKKIKQVEPPFFLLGAFLFMMGFISTVFVFFWAAIFIFISSRYFDFKIDFEGDFWAKLPLGISFTAVFSAFFLVFVVGILESYNFRGRLILDGYPVGAVEYLKLGNRTENLFNEYAWGGYLDWQFDKAKVFIDGRMAGWKQDSGRGILDDYQEILRGNCEIAKTYEIRTVLVKNGEDVPCFDNWELVYKDTTAKVLVR